MAKTKRKRKAYVPQKVKSELCGMTEYYRQMKEILKSIGCEQILDLMPEHDKRATFVARIHSPRLTGSDRGDLNMEQFKSIQEELNRFMQVVFIELGENGPEISPYQFYTYLVTLELLRGLYEQKREPKQLEFCRLLDEKINIPELERELWKKIYTTSTMVSMLTGIPPYELVNIFPERQTTVNSRRTTIVYRIHHRKQKVRQFELKHHSRPAVRLGFLQHDGTPLWTNINRSLLEDVPFDEQQMVPVYVQQHARDRLSQRLDVHFDGDIHINLIFSIWEPKVIRSGDRYLIEYYFEKIKLGYLVGRLVSGCLLIQTFLFLTNHRTPEGTKLEKLSGMCKIDMKYWNIDKLSTYYLTDINKDPKIKDLFEQAGCGALMGDMPFKECVIDGKCQAQLADKFASFLDRGIDDNFVWEDPEESIVNEELPPTQLVS